MTTSPTRPDSAHRSPVEMWDAVAQAWAENAAFIDQRHTDVTRWLLSEVHPGDHVLDLGSGPGGAGVAAADRVGPDGRVVLSDVSPAMARFAAARANRLGLGWVRADVLDIGELGNEPGAQYDVVLSRDGVQFAPDPAQALAGIRHVLKPGGQVALAVWAAPEQNPWLGVVMQAASEVLERPVPPPGVRGPFSLSDRVELERLLLEAGFEHLCLDDVAAPLRAPSLDEWWTRTTALAGPLAVILRSAGPEAEDRVRARAIELVRPYLTEDGVTLPGLALLASARRPA